MHEGFDPEGRRLPIKIDTTSNGEFLPRPLNRLARAANREAHRYVGDCALRLGLSRRTFLKSVCGAAATLLCLNQVFARAGRGGAFSTSRSHIEPDAVSPEVTSNSTCRMPII